MYKNHTGGRKHVLMAIVAILIAIVGDQSLAANYPLEIIQPRAGLTTQNRFYRAYPGLEYNVRVAVVGGDYPYRYELTTAPIGMTINQNTGVITWPSPTTAGSPHTVQARVTALGARGGGDGNGGAQVSVIWTITVTTSQFIFVDAVNGNDANSGTEASPFRTVNGFYKGTFADATYSGYFVYFKNGTYPMHGVGLPTEPCWGGSFQVPMRGTGKPVVWLAYPGHTPTFDFSVNYPQWYGTHNHAYFDGLTFTPISNACRYGLVVSSAGSNVTVRRSTFRQVPVSSGTNNQSQFFSTADGIGNNFFWSLTENTFDDVDHGYFILFYNMNKCLVADNTFTNIRDTAGQGAFHAIGPKVTDQRVHIINNRLSQIAGNGIWIFYAPDHGSSGNIEVAYNLVRNTSQKSVWLNQFQVAGDPIYVYRNTFVAGSGIVWGLVTDAGPFDFRRNVIVNENNNKIFCEVNCPDPSLLIQSENLEGNAAAGIVDASGNLQGAYRTTYLGTRGYELGVGGGSADTTPPASPTSLRIQ